MTRSCQKALSEIFAKLPEKIREKKYAEPVLKAIDEFMQMPV